MPNINCTEFNELLAQAVETHGSADAAALREHALACAGCQAAWLDALLLDRAVARWRETVPAVDLADRILFRLSNERERDLAPASATEMRRTAAQIDPVTIAALPHRRVMTIRRAGLAALATACVALIAIWIGGRVGPRRAIEKVAVSNDAPSRANEHHKPAVHPENPVRQKPDRPAAVDPIVAETGVDSLVSGAGFAYLDLASQAAGAVTAATVLVPAPAPNPDPKTAVERDGRWVDEVGREFAPVTRQLSDAFEFLLEAMPADKMPAT